MSPPLRNPFSRTGTHPQRRRLAGAGDWGQAGRLSYAFWGQAGRVLRHHTGIE
ncbi:MAG: hypothetical protein KME26_12940 [Oscillatoria princeps RMCB-10]|nr:hypothetical protein [Oscillatoria princeps RMCB-10]